MKVIIMRGLPGSGKSTWVKNTLIGTGVWVCSADKFHVGADGVYRFDPSKIGEAHNFCLKDFLRGIDVHAILQGRPLSHVVVDNTNLAAWEIAPYYRLAEAYGLEVEIIRLEVEPILACKRNIHGVPAERIFQMHQVLREAKLPPHWKERIIVEQSV